MSEPTISTSTSTSTLLLQGEEVLFELELISSKLSIYEAWTQQKALHDTVERMYIKRLAKIIIF